MQGNFKYLRIKKIHQVLEKITRVDQKDQNPLCLVINELLSIKYTRSTYQFTHFISYLFQDKFKNSRIIKIHQVHQKLHTKQSFIILFNLLHICKTFEFKVTRIFR